MAETTAITILAATAMLCVTALAWLFAWLDR